MNTIVNISGSTAEDYGKLAGLLDVPGVAAIELNVSCPNVKEGGIVFGTDPEAASAVVREAKRIRRSPSSSSSRRMSRTSSRWPRPSRRPALMPCR